MQIRFHKNFEKSFKKLDKKLKAKVIQSIQLFQENPHSPSLKNHPLKGRLKGLRAFSISADIRIIFEEYENYSLIIMLDVGTHNKVY